MAVKGPKAFTWPWLITAWCMPLLVAGTFGLLYAKHMRDNQLTRAKLVEQRMVALGPHFSLLKKSVESAIKDGGYGELRMVKQTLTLDDPPKEPDAQFTPVQEEYRKFWRKALNGEDGSPNCVGDMRALTAGLHEWTKTLQRELAHKLYNHHYTIRKVVNPVTGEEGFQATGELTRSPPGLMDQELNSWIRPDGARLEEAWNRYKQGEQPEDIQLRTRGLLNVTLEDVARMQNDLLTGLADATSKQYVLLYGEIDGWKPLEDAKKKFDSRVDGELAQNLAEQKRKNEEQVDAVGASLEAEARLYDGVRDGVVSPKDTAVSELGGLVTRINNEVQAHVLDASTFQDLLQANKEIAPQYPIKKHDVDGKITYVNRKQNLCHIGLGSEDNIKPGMRFEVYSITGIGAEELKGAVEVVRTIGKYYSLCVFLDVLRQREQQASDIIREGDAVINRLWEKGKYLTVALHGLAWGPPETRYGKLRLEQMLRDLGVPVHEKVKVDTDIVITGAGLVYDTHYRTARAHLRFEPVPETLVRVYVDPR